MPTKIDKAVDLLNKQFELDGYKEILARFKEVKFPPFQISFDYLGKVTAEAQEAIDIGYDLAKHTVHVVEGLRVEGEELLSSKEKQEVAVKWLDAQIKLNPLMELVDGPIIGYGVSWLVMFFNKELGKGAIALIPKPTAPKVEGTDDGA